MDIVKKYRAIDKYTFEKFKTFLNERNGDIIAIFDIGTKASRILIAPKSVPKATLSEWKKELFFNASGYHRLGEDVDPITNELSLKSEKLWLVIKFIQFFRNYLINNTSIDKNDIRVFGTEVFRWLENKKEVLSLIEKHTSLSFTPLTESQESYFSLIALQYTTLYTSDFELLTPPEIKEYANVFLIDQGGGSTEISFFDTADPNINSHTSISKFGTIALKDIFFRLDSRGASIDPKSCNYSIPKQIDSLNNYIEYHLAKSKYYSQELDKSNIFYGMGSAIHLVTKLSNINSHNKIITLQTIEDLISKIAVQLNNEYRQISFLFNKIEENKLKEGEQNLLTIFYGLPVYAKILRKFGINEIRLAGFGLRYGIYIYLFAQDRSQLANKIFEDIPIEFPEKRLVDEDGGNVHPKSFIEKIKEQLKSLYSQLASYEEKLSACSGNLEEERRFYDLIENTKRRIKELKKEYLDHNSNATPEDVDKLFEKLKNEIMS